MTTRRSFLGAVAAGTAAATAWHRLAEAAPGKLPLGLQLWSVRAALAKDVPGTLRQIKGWGIDEVETFGPYGAQIAPQLKAAGLAVKAMHVGYDQLSRDVAGVLRDADALGATTLVNPYLPHESKPFASREEILRAAGDFAKWSKACRAAGKRFAYHIHGQEFGKAPEGTLFDVLARESGPDVGFEADVYWVVAGGADPLALMKAHAGRIWYTHLKDMAKGVAPGSEATHREESNVVLGAGQIDVKGVLAASAKAGVELHYLEDESADPFGQIPKSVAYYRSI